LPAYHLRDESRDTIKLGIGLVATLTALVLGLVTASTKSTFDDLNTTIKHAAADILATDRLLARYGPETKELQATLKRVIAHRIATAWPQGSSQAAMLDPSAATAAAEGFVDQIALAPQSDIQRWLQSRALEQSEALLKTRWVVLGALGTSVPWPFLIVLLFWLTITFTSFGLQAPANATVLSVILVCALSVAGAVFLVLEMDGPFEGMIQVSAEPLRYALARLGL
jgi:hypothetical protein